MKFSLLTILFALALAFAPRAAAQTRQSPAKDEPAAGELALERRAEAEPRAVVSLCVNSGDVIVRGWDRAEVRARRGRRDAAAPDAERAPRAARRGARLRGEGCRAGLGRLRLKPDD